MARRTVNITPVDEGRGRVTDHPARGQLEALFDRNLFERTVRKERSSAYWFAAALWGFSGLIIGGLMGWYITLQTTAASAPTLQDAFTRGMAIEQARQRSDSNPALDLNHPNNNNQQPPQQH